MYNTHYYNGEFYDSQKSGSFQSAEQILPVVIPMVGKIDSVLDLGCGVGTWLSVFESHGIKDILGVDGFYVDKSKLLIGEKNFMPFDLSTPLNLNRKFDLALSLEVAEHIPPGSAQIFVDSLCMHSDTVLFSAAIPGQGGRNHINEQYPSYWVELFAKNQFYPIDCVRGRIWRDNKIEDFYRQNILVYATKASFIYKNFEQTLPIDIVHPEIYLGALSPKSLNALIHMQFFILKSFPKYVVRVAKRKLSRIIKS